MANGGGSSNTYSRRGSYTNYSYTSNYYGQHNDDRKNAEEIVKNSHHSTDYIINNPSYFSQETVDAARKIEGIEGTRRK